MRMSLDTNTQAHTHTRICGGLIDFIQSSTKQIHKISPNVEKNWIQMAVWNFDEMKIALRRSLLNC